MQQKGGNIISIQDGDSQNQSQTMETKSNHVIAASDSPFNSPMLKKRRGIQVGSIHSVPKTTTT